MISLVGVGEGDRRGRKGSLPLAATVALRGEEKEELPWEGEEEDEGALGCYCGLCNTDGDGDGREEERPRRRRKLRFFFSDFGFKSEPEHYINYKFESEMFGSDRVNPIFSDSSEFRTFSDRFPRVSRAGRVARISCAPLVFTR